MPKLAVEPSRRPDHFTSGPDIPFGASMRARYLQSGTAVLHACSDVWYLRGDGLRQY
jgi:hypothetical protein